jgi:beta-xylosidase
LLTLQANPQKGADFLGAVLARPTTTGNYEATARLDRRNLSPGVAAGLSAFGDAANAMGLVVTNQKLLLWRRDKGKQVSLAEADAPSGEQMFLRLTADQGHRFQFSSSADGKAWKNLGEDLEGKSLPPWDRSIRVALTVGGETNAAARFDRIEIVPRAQRSP